MNISPHKLTFHPLADLFPRMSDGDYRTLVDSIREAGEVSTPIVLDTKGAVIDGRHRVDACIELDIEVPFRTYRGDDIQGHVVALNLHRRHLTESQRAMIAARMANMEAGENQYSKEVAPIGATSQTDAAAKLKVSRRAVQRATVVQSEGTKELAIAVDQGDVPVSVAAQAAKVLSPEETAEALSDANPKQALVAAVKAKTATADPPMRGFPLDSLDDAIAIIMELPPVARLNPADIDFEKFPMVAQIYEASHRLNEISDAIIKARGENIVPMRRPS